MRSLKDGRKTLKIHSSDVSVGLRGSFATINRWENGKTTLFKLARAQFDAFCKKMTKQGKLKRLEVKP